MTSGLAFQMRIQLAKLALRHGVVAKPTRIAAEAAASVPVILEGVCASAVQIDSHFQVFRPFAFPLPTFSWDKMPPLRMRHGAVDVGSILAFSYDRTGSLRVRARVEDRQAAALNAFSICATVHDFEIINQDSRDFHALIRRADIVEVSLTDSPASPSCLVDSRESVPAYMEFFDLMAHRVEKMRDIVAIVRNEIDREPPPPPPPEPAASRRTPTRPWPTSSFSSLVHALDLLHNHGRPT